MASTTVPVPARWQNALSEAITPAAVCSRLKTFACVAIYLQSPEITQRAALVFHASARGERDTPPTSAFRRESESPRGLIIINIVARSWPALSFALLTLGRFRSESRESAAPLPADAILHRDHGLKNY